MKHKALMAAFVLSALPAPAWAQHCQPKVKKDVSTCGNPEMALPDKPLEGLGDLTHPVSTSNKLAQKFFDQGLTLHYAFNNEQAVLFFKKAAELDPSLAMADWGVALAATTNINVDSDDECVKLGTSHLQLAMEKARGEGTSQSDRDIVMALAARYPSSEARDDNQRAVNYSLAMAQLFKKYPGDADVATLYADSLMNLQPWRLWERCEPLLRTPDILQALESVLKPTSSTRNHLGANHFYIHTLEGSCRPEQAERSAQVLRDAKLFSAGHLVHMPSHIAMRTGRYELAARDNEAAVQADKKAYGEACDRHDSKKCMPLYVGHYLGHNLFFELAANQQLGRLEKSLQISKDLEQRTKDYVDNEPGLEHFLVSRLLTLARFRQWKAVLEVPQPEARFTMAQAVWRWGRTMALAATRAEPEKLAAERELYRRASAEVLPALSWGNNKATAFIPLLNYLLSGQEAESSGNPAGAIELYRLAVNEEDHLIYDEPNPWPLTARESLGGAYLRNGQFQEAQRVFEEDLKPRNNPGSGRSLFGRWKSLEGQCAPVPARGAKSQTPPVPKSGRCQQSEVKKAESAFNAAWKHADVPLTIDQL